MLAENEILTEIVIPVPQSFAYAKFDQPASRFALVGVAVARTSGGVRVAVTGAGQGGVFRWTEAEQALTANFAPAALSNLKVDPANLLSDVHADADYRAHLVGVMAKRAVSGLAFVSCRGATRRLKHALAEGYWRREAASRLCVSSRGLRPLRSSLSPCLRERVRVRGGNTSDVGICCRPSSRPLPVEGTGQGRELAAPKVRSKPPSRFGSGCS